MPYVININQQEASGRDLVRYEKLVAEDQALEERRVQALERIAAALEGVKLSKGLHFGKPEPVVQPYAKG